MGSKGGSSTTQSNDPWTGQQPYLKDAFAQAQNLYRSGGPDFYSGATYVPFSQQTEAALRLMQNRAMQGNPLNTQSENVLGQAIGGTTAGQKTLANTASGSMLNANPYLSRMMNAASADVTRNFQNAVMPGINATFGGAGRTGSGAQTAALGEAQRGLADELSQMSTNIYGSNYANERQNQLSAANQLLNSQMQAINMAPTVANQAYADFDRLYGVGQAVEGKAGQMLQDTMDRYNWYQNLPQQNLQNYIAAIQGNYGSNITQQNPGGSRLSGALGGAMAGSAFGPIGAGVGGLLGAFA